MFIYVTLFFNQNILCMNETQDSYLNIYVQWNSFDVTMQILITLIAHLEGLRPFWLVFSVTWLKDKKFNQKTNILGV